MPIYEYRCPNGHTFELFQKMSDGPRRAARLRREPGRESPVPGGGALQGLRLLLDRLRPRSRKGAAKDGDGGGSGEKSDSGEKKESSSKDSGSGDKKTAAAD